LRFCFLSFVRGLGSRFWCHWGSFWSRFAASSGSSGTGVFISSTGRCDIIGRTSHGRRHGISEGNSHRISLGISHRISHGVSNASQSTTQASASSSFLDGAMPRRNNPGRAKRPVTVRGSSNRAERPATTLPMCCHTADLLCAGGKAAWSLQEALARFPPAPTANTNQDLHNLDHRLSGVIGIQRTADFHLCAALVPYLLPIGPRPVLPHHRLMSKRAWEAAMRVWRKEIRDLARACLRGLGESSTACMCAASTIDADNAYGHPHIPTYMQTLAKISFSNGNK
jgi:hypothetical protein